MSLQRGPSLSAREIGEIVDRASHQKNSSKRPKLISPGIKICKSIAYT